MAVPTYDHDLTDIDLAEAVGDYIALQSSGGAGLAADPDFAIEGTNSITKQVSNARKGIAFDNPGGAITIPAGDHIYVWIYCTTPGLLETLAIGGLCVSIGDSNTARNEFHIAGATEYAQGGWLCIPIKYVTTANGSHPYRTLVGTPAGEPTIFGVIADTTATVKAVNTSVDAMRYGTGAYITVGASGTPATFAGFAAVNDGVNARFGILTAVPGGYALQGRFVVGQDNTQTPTEAYFDDSNALITLTDTFHSEADFTQIIVDHALTTFNMTNITVLALGTINPGKLVFNDASTTSALTTCTFDGIGITTLRAGVVADGCIWRGSDQVTMNGASVNNCSVLTSTVATGSGAIVYDEATDPAGEMDNMTFSQGASAHSAIEFGTNVTANIKLIGCDFTGFGSTDDVDGAVFKFLATGGSLNLSLENCTTDGTFSIDETAGVDVTLVIDPVTTLVHVDDHNGDALIGVRVILEAKDASGDFPFEETVVGITNLAGTATVDHTGHGLKTNDYAIIRGANEQEYNGPFSIIVTDVDTYTYTISGSPTSPASGTITSTGASISGTTDSGGNISADRTFLFSQPVIGFARKSSASPRYKTFPLDDTISKANGLTINVRLIKDE